MTLLQTLSALLAFEQQELEAREALYRGKDEKAWLLHSAKLREVLLIRDWIASLCSGKAEFFGGVSRGADYFHVHGKFPADGQLEIGAAVPGEIAANLRAGKKFYVVTQLEANEFARRVLSGITHADGVADQNDCGQQTHVVLQQKVA